MPSDAENRSQAKLDRLELAIGTEERRLSAMLGSEALRRFSRRIEHWDLLLRILEQRDNNCVGLNDIVLRCKSGTMHPHSLAKFLREQISAGLVYAEEGDRRDKKVIRASDQLISEFLMLSKF